MENGKCSFGYCYQNFMPPWFPTLALSSTRLGLASASHESLHAYVNFDKLCFLILHYLLLMTCSLFLAILLMNVCVYILSSQCTNTFGM